MLRKVAFILMVNAMSFPADRVVISSARFWGHQITHITCPAMTTRRFSASTGRSTRSSLAGGFLSADVIAALYYSREKEYVRSAGKSEDERPTGKANGQNGSVSTVN